MMRGSRSAAPLALRVSTFVTSQSGSGSGSLAGIGSGCGCSVLLSSDMDGMLESEADERGDPGARLDGEPNAGAAEEAE
jgi:hypothetical protein